MEPELIYYWQYTLETRWTHPYASLTEGNDGKFYSTTYGFSPLDQYGTVYSISTDGSLTTLASFNGTNGAYPSSLTFADDGNLYGTTQYGGTSNYGTIFRVTTNGELTTIVSFNFTNGANPRAALRLGPDGLLYGTTYTGGITNSLNISTNYAGTVFKVSTNGELTSLVTFSASNGSGPMARLAWGPDGLLYGTTFYGGVSSGNVFKITTNGELTSVVSFVGANGSYPIGGLTLGPDGNLYGTTRDGGTYSGTVFRMTTNGDLTTIVSFNGINGYEPEADLLLAPDGNLYGTTLGGGTNGSGTLFQITTNGTHTILVSFKGSNGASPWPGPTLGSDGNLYGVATEAGPGGSGTIFRLNTRPLLTGLARQGQNVLLNGTGLPNDPYRVWARADISGSAGSWTPVTSNFFNASGNMSYTEPATNSQRFYRLSAP